jgi:hypothetical protein
VDVAKKKKVLIPVLAFYCFKKNNCQIKSLDTKAWLSINLLLEIGKNKFNPTHGVFNS